MTLLFDLPVEQSRERASHRARNGTADRLDVEDAAFHTRVREAYLKIAAAEPERVRIIDATGSVQETYAQMLEIVSPLLKLTTTDHRR